MTVRSMQDADQAGDEEGQRQGDEERGAEQVWRMGADQLLHDEGRVGSDHDHLAMGHVDDAHGAERDRETDGREQKNGTERHAVPDILDGIPEREPAADAFGGLGSSLSDIGRRAGRQVREKRQGVLVAASLQGFDGGDFFGSGSIRLIEKDSGARIFEGHFHIAFALLCNGLLEGRQGGGIAGAEDGAGGIEAGSGIGAEQGHAAERRFDGAANAVVEPHGLGACGGFGGLARRSIDGLAGGIADIDLPTGHQQLPIAQGFDQLQGQGMSAAGDGADGGLRVGIAVGGEFRQCVFVGSGDGGGCHADQQNECLQNAAQACHAINFERRTRRGRPCGRPRFRQEVRRRTSS